MGRNRHRENPPPRCSPRFGGGKLLSRLDAASKKRHLESPPPRFGGDKLRRLHDGMVKKPDQRGLLLNADEEVQKGDGGKQDLLLLNADEVQKGDGGEHNMLPNADEVQKGDGGQSNMLLNDGGEHNDLLLTADELKNKPALSKDERMRLFRLTFHELLDKPKTEWTDKELLLRCPQYLQYKISEEDGLKEMPNLRKYLKQLHDSEGFDITGPLPRIGLPQERIRPVQLKTEKHYKYVKNLAQLAIESYNDNNEDFPVKTNFQVVQVEKVTRSSFSWSIYYVTFTAKDESPRQLYRSPKTFQAEVEVSPSNERIVEFCRLKAKR